MFGDCECPFCYEEIEIKEAFNEGDPVEMNCDKCGQAVLIYVHTTVSYKAFCGRGLHDNVPSKTHPGWEDCTRCGYFGKKKT